MLDELRKGLIDAFKHRLVDDAWCIGCGRMNVPLALHAIEFYHVDSMNTPQTLVPMSKSRGTTRGSVPLCNSCCPPCSQCSLPIATPWSNKLLAALKEKYQGISFVAGNGICKHVHVLLDVKSLFRSANIFVAPSKKIPTWRPRSFHENESKEDIADWFAHADLWNQVDPRLIQLLIDRLYGNQMFEVFVHASLDSELISEYVKLRVLFDKGIGDVATLPKIAGFLFTAGASHAAAFTNDLSSGKRDRKDIEKHYMNALNAMEAAINVEPGLLEAYLGLAHLRQLVGKKEDAINFCNQGLKQVDKMKKYPLPRRPEMDLMGAVESTEKQLRSLLRELHA